MRSRVFLLVILMALIASIISPASFKMIKIRKGRRPLIILSLDVCHASNSSLSVNADKPCLCECTYKPVPLKLISLYEIISPRLDLPILAFTIEQPPKV
ncbi:hypothetical protein A45J_1795 [hot springs metagenome]|uniref:Uncharacterized protein n=1 Tax=hot springs metagenome TaxID=433727 RepID=A0A5J4L5G6_9ZZZZ